MKVEPAGWALAITATAGLGPVVGLPEEQQVYLWSVAGTVVGSAIASAQMPEGTTHMQRLMRAVVSLCSGLLIAPYAVWWLPKPDEVPNWWHAFGASGIAAASGYALASELPQLLRKWLRDRFGVRNE